MIHLLDTFMKITTFGWVALNLCLTIGVSVPAADPGQGLVAEADGGSVRAASLSSGQLLNIDFTSDLNPQYLPKMGPAAVGVTADDYWNVYSRDDGSGGFRPNGSLSGLRYADQQPGGATLEVSNAAGAWINGAADPMFDWYLYPLGGGEISLALTQLPPGNYDFYIFGHGSLDDQNGIYELVSGGTNYGTQATTTGPGWINPRLTEGQQYVRFGNVRVTGMPR
jgi:hypothetical protein